MQSNRTTYLIRGEEAASKHSVLRNTYLLLSATLLFSAGAAAFAMVQNAGFASSLVAMVAAIVLLFVTSSLRNSAWGILGVFAFTGCMGYSMGPMLNHFMTGYQHGGRLILSALGSTGAVFLVSSAYMVTTKKDLSHWGKFLMIGLIVCIVGGLLNIFLKMPAIQLAMSSMMTLISVMLMMYDTSRIVNSGERNYIMATISLYLDIQMLFQNLLMLLGAFNGRD